MLKSNYITFNGRTIIEDKSISKLYNLINDSITDIKKDISERIECKGISNAEDVEAYWKDELGKWIYMEDQDNYRMIKIYGLTFTFQKAFQMYDSILKLVGVTEIGQLEITLDDF